MELHKTLFGAVHLATDLQTGARVAIKLSEKAYVRAGVARSGVRVREDPRREAELMSLLDHRNIVGLHDFLEDDKDYWTIMEFCSLGELYRRLPELCGNPLRNREVVRELIRQVLRAVAFMHSLGVCHLDISPENLLIGDDGAMRLADFGHAMRCRAGQMFPPIADPRLRPGKPTYCAPEFNDADCWFDGQKADMFSCGVVFFILIAGVPPFEYSIPDDRRFALIYGGRIADLIRAWRLGDIVDAQAMDFLSSLICAPERRMAADQALRHPFLA